MFEARFEEDGSVAAPRLTPPSADGHKYDRGHAFILSGPRHRTGAARLAAMACLRVGAGLVTLVGEAAALDEHAAQVAAIMLREDDGVCAFIDDRTGALAMGPGLGAGERTRAKVLDWLDKGFPAVLDADALTSFAGDPDTLFAALRDDVVLTPHAGEFARLFPDIAMDDRKSAVCVAAERSGAVVLLKGAQTHIADPTGRHAVNRHASPWLATAGAGDVLTGMIAGLLSQHLLAFDAAAVAAWLHGDAGMRGGAGLVADDLPGLIVGTLQDLSGDIAE
ncbi:NAD(P)H-hydrate dehydratase [Novosphingopyxis sp.]|uniref:NAD(P)H-hydrate dehydratase n=1 Tax=Novosphingopyxis sp. TaxID=2709690 RepID=UPI003B598F32